MTNFIKSVMSGIMIGIGGCVYLSCDNKYIGAFLFSLGLFTICEFALGLYTGKVGYIFIKKGNFYIEVLITLLANAVGTVICGELMRIARPDIIEKVCAVCDAKTELSLAAVLIRSFMCGVLMFVAVNSYNEGKGAAKYIGIFTAIPVFILAGFEHSVANVFYFVFAGKFSLQIVWFIVLCAIGNALGSQTLAAVWKMQNKQ